MSDHNSINPVLRNLPSLGLGGASLGNLFRAMECKDAISTVQACLSSGINFFDTAPHYGQGLSERRLGDALRELRGDGYILSTKVGRLLEPAAYKDMRQDFVSPMPFAASFDYTRCCSF